VSPNSAAADATVEKAVVQSMTSTAVDDVEERQVEI
jgi:hypothetical protein